MQGMLLLQDFAVALLVAGVVGWIFRRLGLSVVVGFLVAGLLIGPYTPPFSLITDQERIATLSQMGLVFLMFFVGLGLSLERIRRLGLSLLLTTFLAAFFVFFCSRILGLTLGFGGLQGTFLAALFMASSSAIIVRTLHESGQTHDKSGQLAMGITVLEDVVAVIMLALLTARVRWSGAGGAQPEIARTVWLLGGFAVFTVVCGLLFLPRILKKLDAAVYADLLAVLVAGLLFGASWLAARMGYSVALGAFLFGMIIAETSVKIRIQKIFGGAQEMFSALFFVSIGMSIRPGAFFEHGGLILGLAAFALVVRSGASALAFCLTGSGVSIAVRTALLITPIGEFAYVISQMGVSAAVLPEYFAAVAVGVSLVTAVTAPLLLRLSERAGEQAEKSLPCSLQRMLEIYQSWLARLQSQKESNIYWKLLRPRLAQIALELMLMAGMMGLADIGHELIGDFLRDSHLYVPVWEAFYWGLLTLAVLGLALMAWRELDAVSMMTVEAVVGLANEQAPLRRIVFGAFQTLSVMALGGMIWFLKPTQMENIWANLLLVISCCLLIWVFWRRLSRWHSQFHLTLGKALEGEAIQQLSPRLSQNLTHWQVELAECELPSGTEHAGKSLIDLELRSKFECSIVQIDRSGYTLSNPSPEMAVYPGDRLLLFGTESQIGSARSYLMSEATTPPSGEFNETTLEITEVPWDSPRSGKTLAELRVFAETGVQILGIERDGQNLLAIKGGVQLLAGDTLLILTTHWSRRRFERWLQKGT